MKKFSITQTLLNRDAILSTAWSTVQQLVVAASTFFILEAIGKITSGELKSGMIYVGLFVASLVLVYLPCTISMYYLERWRISSFNSFVTNFVQTNEGKTTYGHAKNKAQIESWLTNESATVYDKTTDLLYQLYSTGLNSSFNILSSHSHSTLAYWVGILPRASHSLFQIARSRN